MTAWIDKRGQIRDDRGAYQYPSPLQDVIVDSVAGATERRQGPGCFFSA